MNEADSNGETKSQQAQETKLESLEEKPLLQPETVQSGEAPQPKQFQGFEEQFRLCAIVQDRCHHFFKYEDCFVGSETVDRLVASHVVSSRAEAVEKGQQLLSAGVFSHVSSPQPFKDEYQFYRFSAPVLPSSSIDPFLVLSQLSPEQRLQMMDSGFGTLPQPRPMDPNSTAAPLVFIHGIFGSYLQDFRLRGSQEDGKVAVSSIAPEGCYWITALQGLGAKSDIRLPLEWHNGRQAYGPNPLISTSCIHTVAKLVKTYGPFLDWANASFPAGFVHPFAYDWRRDNNESVDLFILHLEAVVARHKRRPVVVAHSNGGLVAMAALNERPDLFRGVVFCGAAIGPGVSYMLDFQYGSSAKDKKCTFFPGILNNEALCSHASYYSFIDFGGASKPWAHTKDFWNPTFTDEKGEPVDLSDVNNWIKHKLGVFRTSGNEEAKTIHMQNVLACARRLRERVAPKPKSFYPPLRAISSRNKEVACHVGVEAVGELQPLSSLGGDGRVPWEASRPGGDVECPIIESTYAHSAIPNDLALMQRAIKEVLSEGSGPETCPF